MNRTSRTQTADDVGHDLTEIVDHLTRRRGCHWRLCLANIDSQRQMVWLTMKTGRVGVILHDAWMAEARELPRCPPMHPPRQCRWNL